MKITNSSEKERDEITESVLTILKQNNLLTLSTINNKEPHSCSAYYVSDNELNLYIWTDSDAIHSKNIKDNPTVSINIASTSQKFGSLLKGIQAQGKAETISEKEMLKYGALYIKKFPAISKFLTNPKDFLTKFKESKIYRIKLHNIKLLDEEKFGKEEYKEIKLK